MKQSGASVNGVHNDYGTERERKVYKVVLTGGEWFVYDGLFMFMICLCSIGSRLLCFFWPALFHVDNILVYQIAQCSRIWGSDSTTTQQYKN